MGLGAGAGTWWTIQSEGGRAGMLPSYNSPWLIQTSQSVSMSSVNPMPPLTPFPSLPTPPDHSFDSTATIRDVSCIQTNAYPNPLLHFAKTDTEHSPHHFPPPPHPAPHPSPSFM
ncbi:hypothetical protein PAXINDRAFT_96041, partial [Paxillus involutus ATCC 200175]